MAHPLLAALQSRSSAFTEGGGPTPVLSQDAEIEATQLVRAALYVPPDRRRRTHPLPPMLCAPWPGFYWCRSKARPDTEHDRQSALQLFAILARTSPELIPEELADTDLIGRDRPGGDPDQWVRPALMILEEIQRSPLRRAAASPTVLTSRELEGWDHGYEWWHRRRRSVD